MRLSAGARVLKLVGFEEQEGRTINHRQTQTATAADITAPRILRVDLRLKYPCLSEFICGYKTELRSVGILEKILLRIFYRVFYKSKLVFRTTNYYVTIYDASFAFSIISASPHFRSYPSCAGST